MSRFEAHVGSMNRRRFLSMAAAGGGILTLAACSTPSAPPAQPVAQQTDPAPTNTPEPAAAPAAPDDEVEVMARDVLDYVLESDDWQADYGQVTFRIHEAVHNGESVYYIRTDASDPDFASEVGLVYVPLLNVASAMDNVNRMYLFEDDRPAVITYAPGDEMYSSLFQLIRVTAADDSMELTNAEAVSSAGDDGAITLEETAIYVNYPLIKWRGGGLTVDSELIEVLPGGQLFEEADLDNMTVKMKLHQCYPGSRYILTDTGAAPMAPMMNIPAAAPTQQLQALGGTDEIWVFGNGISGPGVMGFQPAIFDNKAGQPAWSPFWNHFTVTWTDGSEPHVLTTSAEIRELVESGALEQWNGVPDSHPNGFVVNCPAPILAPNTFSA